MAGADYCKKGSRILSLHHKCKRLRRLRKVFAGVIAMLNSKLLLPPSIDIIPNLSGKIKDAGVHYVH